MIAETHKRQFFFVRSQDDRSSAPAGWRKIVLPQDWTLHLHPETAFEILDADPEAPAIRIGQAYALDAGEDSGGGRFALLKWPVLTTDCGALMALYYGARDGREVVSSSAALAARLLGARPLAEAAALEHRSSFNYIPAPGAPFGGLAKLLHDQTLDLARFRARHRPSPIRRLASSGAALAALTGELLRFAGELRARVPGKVYLPLTAGLDSRTLAAAFVAAGLPFEAVTLDYCGKPRADVTVAAAISRRIGVRHHVIRLDAPNAGVAARFAEHTGGAFLDWDHSHIVPGGGYRYLGPGDAMIVGACFEIGRQQTDGTCFKDCDFAGVDGAEVWRRRAGGPPPRAFAGFLDDWIAWRRAHPLDMDFAAAFYLDQRIGGWRAAVEQGYDLLPGVSLCPANNPRIYSAMITPSRADQREGRLQKEAIGLLAPELLRFPINPESLRRRARRIRRRLGADLAAAVAGLLPTRRLDPFPGE